MSINLVSLKCPECGAQLEIKDNRSHIFCMYCGTRILINNENEYIVRHIDEASIKQAETDRIINLKRLEFAERKQLSELRGKKFKIIISLTFAIVGILMFIIGNFLGEATGNPDSSFYMLGIVGLIIMEIAACIWLFPHKKEEDDYFGDMIKVPMSIANYEDKSCVSIEAMFRGAGFTNISCIPLNDLTTGLLKKPNTVESITINGKEITVWGKKFSHDAAVVISYHSFANRR